MTLVWAGSALAAGYDATVLADSPIAYWRLGEPDGATTAADASGHGVTLDYTSGALLEIGAGIQDQTDTAMGSDNATAASRTGPLGDVSTPTTFEGWIRSDIVDSTATIYHFADNNGTYTVTVDTDGLPHASSDDLSQRLCCQNVSMVGPSTQPVTDGLWHYVVVDFATHYIYVDLVQGPPGVFGGSSPRPAALSSQA